MLLVGSTILSLLDDHAFASSIVASPLTTRFAEYSGDVVASLPFESVPIACAISVTVVPLGILVGETLISNGSFSQALIVPRLLNVYPELAFVRVALPQGLPSRSR
jgi:hypothetical protein